jgi:hypothetical protein
LSKRGRATKFRFKPYLGSTTEKASEAGTAPELWSLDLFKDIPARKKSSHKKLFIMHDSKFGRLRYNCSYIRLPNKVGCVENSAFRM